MQRGPVPVPQRRMHRGAGRSSQRYSGGAGDRGFLVLRDVARTPDAFLVPAKSQQTSATEYDAGYAALEAASDGARSRERER